MEKIRLQKFFTDMGIMSRRASEKVIEAGNVKVNGQIAKLGDKVDPENDTIVYNGKVIKPSSEKKRYIMLNIHKRDENQINKALDDIRDEE